MNVLVCVCMLVSIDTAMSSKATSTTTPPRPAPSSAYPIRRQLFHDDTVIQPMSVFCPYCGDKQAVDQLSCHLDEVWD